MASPRSAVILMVEDDKNDVFFLKRALQRAEVPFPLRVVSDGEQAVSYLAGDGAYADRRKYPLPCLVLLDIKLPKRTGLEVLRWLRVHPEHGDLPVVMVTSSDEPQDRREAQQQGVEEYQVKPISFEGLVGLAQDIRKKAEVHCESAQPCVDPEPGTGPP